VGTTALWALLLLAGCSGKYGRTVPDDMVNKLTYEDKVDLVEAENDLFRRLRPRRRRGERDPPHPRSDSPGEEVRIARRGEIGQAKDPNTKELAVLSRDEAQARVEYLRARQDWNVRNRELDELNRTCAVTRYQLARLTAVRKVKVPGSERYDPKDFDRQVRPARPTWRSDGRPPNPSVSGWRKPGRSGRRSATWWPGRASTPVPAPSWRSSR
jgi:hypothetical protein